MCAIHTSENYLDIKNSSLISRDTYWLSSSMLVLRTPTLSLFARLGISIMDFKTNNRNIFKRVNALEKIIRHGMAN